MKHSHSFLTYYLKCSRIMDDTKRRAGLYVMTRGTRIGWLVSGVSLIAIALERGMPLMRPISWLRKDRLYPRLLRYVLSSLVRCLKVSSGELIRRSLRAKLPTRQKFICEQGRT